MLTIANVVVLHHFLKKALKCCQQQKRDRNQAIWVQMGPKVARARPMKPPRMALFQINPQIETIFWGMSIPKLSQHNLSFQEPKTKTTHRSIQIAHCFDFAWFLRDTQKKSGHCNPYRPDIHPKLLSEYLRSVQNTRNVSLSTGFPLHGWWWWWFPQSTPQG